MRCAVAVGAVMCMAGLVRAQDGGIMVRPPEAQLGDAKPEVVIQATPVGKAVTCMAYSRTARLVASGGTDWTVRLWDAVTLAPRGEPLAGHTLDVTSVAFSPDGATLAAGSRDGTVWLWSVATGQRRGQPLKAAAADSLAFSPDGRVLAAGLWSGDVWLWEVATGQRCGVLTSRLTGLHRSVGSLVFAPDGRTLAAKHGEHDVWLWDVPSCQRRAAPWEQAKPAGDAQPRGMVDKNAVFRVAFSPDGRWLATSSQEGSVRLWDAATGQPSGAAFGERMWVNSLAFSPDGQTLAVASREQVRLWRVAGRQPVGEAFKADRGQLWSVDYTADGTALALGLDSPDVRLWDIATGRGRCGQHVGAAAVVSSVAYSPDGRTLAVGGLGGLQRWDLATGRIAGVLPLGSDSVGGVAFSPDGRTLATGTWLEPVRLWEAVASQPHGTVLPGDLKRSRTVAFSRDGRMVAAGSGNSVVGLWDIASGPSPGAPRKLPVQIILNSVAFSPDSLVLAVAGIGVTLWDTASARPLTVLLQNRFVSSLAFSPIGRTLALEDTASHTVQLWDVAQANPRGVLTIPAGGGALRSLAFSPDGRRMAAGSDDHTVRLWDLTTGQPRGTVLTGHAKAVNSVAFSPDGRTLASGSDDGTVRVWAAATGAPVATCYSFDRGQRFLIVTPSGHYSGSLDVGEFIQWRIGQAHYPFDQFALRYHRPDLVGKALAGEDISAARPLDASMVPPNVGFVAPRYGAEIAGDTIPVVIEAAGRHPIARLDLTANGQPLPARLSQALEVPTTDQSTHTFRLLLPLPPGEPRVRLRAVAYDTESLRSKVAEVTVFRPGVKQAVGALHVLAIGINHYAKLPPQFQLRFAVPDAKSIARALAGQGGGRPYTEVKTRLLLDGEATVTNLKFALRDLKDMANENDVAVIFVSGHGTTGKDGTFFFPATEVDLGDLPGTALSWQDFAAALREVRAKRVLVLADTCHSGGIVGEQALASEPLTDRLNRDAHQMVFTAAARNEVSIGTEKFGHGLFTQAIVEGLVGAADDGPKDGNITFAELRDFVVNRVSELTSGQQHPQLPFLDNFEPEAVLARALYAQPR